VAPVIDYGPAVDRTRAAAGFSLLEVITAIAVMLTVMSTVFALMNPAEGAFLVAPEAADLQQRLRVATDTLHRSLMMAGAGPHHDRQAGGLLAFFAPVMPFRRGAVGDASAGSFTTDTITILYVPARAAETTTSMPVAGAHAALRVNDGNLCPREPAGIPKPVCGFQPGMSLLIVDEAGRYDVFTVTAVEGDTAQLIVHKPATTATTMYPAGSKVVEVVDRTYTLHADVARKQSQLVTYDGSDRADVPVVDNVVSLGFEYFGEARPPEPREAFDDRTRTSYGPSPPPAGVRWTAYPEGENCAITVDASGNRVPRLTILGGGSNAHALVRLTESQLTDGPWCPDAVSPDRFDADLLRIRAIAVTLRVQAALAALRGPAGALFVNAGTSADASRWVPDQEVRFEVAPRNLNLAR
jgi:hypothetical protein